MKTLAGAVLAAITLAGPTLAVAGGKPTDSGSKPSSYAPGPKTNRHIYGAPIEPPITGHAKASHQAHANKKKPKQATARPAHRAPANHAGARTRPQAPGPRPSPR